MRHRSGRQGAVPEPGPSCGPGTGGTYQGQLVTPEEALAAADDLADPAEHPLALNAWWPQSLAHGVPGVALLHVEAAAAGLRSWDRVHRWLRLAARAPVTAGSSAGSWYGAPALAYVMGRTAAARPGTYRSALESLDVQIAHDVRYRVALAHQRIDAGRLPLMAEFDALRGLSGLGALLLHRDPGGPVVREVLGYLVRLALPVTHDGTVVPGWWTPTAPTGRRDDRGFPGGHANLGMAHGVGGPLALMALALLRGVEVPGQREAVAALCAWLDDWRLDTSTGARWPYMVTRSELHARPARVEHCGATRRPSWCYGTFGAARVHQLAGIALGDRGRQQLAESALLGALRDPAQLGTTTDGSLCHGHAGLARITSRAAQSASGPTAGALRARCGDHLLAAGTAGAGPGLLEGAAGSALAALAPLTGGQPVTDWDACLLIT
ncbi:lanthionine synthetase C family protein [Streptomyces otsuchiensis]|uniref:lanthionine synthetase C family protein n=1 Tax=Streptomyces otsuchiensis TaxID=2681388 RepID=UPI0027D9A760|nr:lanthionine synthetase C family protein [Streptomyces otsuchiensis]